MEIPYTVTARKDTGLFNSKIGIWLFLASEVMLFGGLFSGYVFLRIYADYPWPERALPILPGLINTFVLIGSSVTVVFAWASLKMRQWRRFQIFMAITIACAAVFMILKAIEYTAKWEHQAVRMDDFVIIEGHTHEAEIKDGHLHVVHHGEGHGEAKEKAEEHGSKFWANRLVFTTKAVSFSLARAHKPWIESMLEQAAERHAELVASDHTFFYGHVEDYPPTEEERKAAEQKLIDQHQNSEPAYYRFGKNSLYVAKGTPLDHQVLAKARDIFVEGRADNAAVRTKLLKEKWAAAHAAHPGKPNWQIADGVKIAQEDLVGKVVGLNPALSFDMNPPAALVLKRSWIRNRPLAAGAASASLRDDTSLSGKLEDSPIALAVDAVDFRWMAQKAEEADKDPMTVIENSWIFSEENEHAGEFKAVWGLHKKRVKQLEDRLLEKYGEDKRGNPKRVPTETERYRIGWKDLVQYARAQKKGLQPGEEGFAKLRPTMTEGFAGPSHKKEEYKELHPFLELEIPHEKVSLESKFTPKWNTYYAIYFTLTGLHGLHVVGGAIVLSYYLFFSKGLYRRNPEWLANRVEVGGLFWHFVDLIWIFLFPILYLM